MLWLASEKLVRFIENNIIHFLIKLSEFFRKVFLSDFLRKRTWLLGIDKDVYPILRKTIFKYAFLPSIVHCIYIEYCDMATFKFITRVLIIFAQKTLKI